MAKKTATNIVEVWSWLVNVMEEGSLNAVEQATLFHVIAKLNRNLWKPAKINTKIIAAAINKDPRTVKTAIQKIVNLKILRETEGEYYLGEQFKNHTIPTDSDEPRFSFKRGGNVTADSDANHDTDNGRGTAEGVGTVKGVGTAGRRRKIFNEVQAD